MFHVKNRMQLQLPINLTRFKDKKHNYLKKTVYHTFRTKFLPYLPVSLYKNHFNSEFGRKTKDIQSILGLFILQALFEMTDKEAQEAFMFDQKTQYALDVKENESYLSPRAFYYYKGKLLGTEQQIFERVLEKIFDEIGFEHALQRTDSSLVRLNLKRMSEWELFKTTLVKALKEIKKSFPILFKKIPDNIQLYVKESEKNTWFTDFTPSKAKEYLQQAAQDALTLKEIFADHPKVSKLQSFQLVLRLIDERVTIDEDQTQVGLKNECKGSAMVNPHDPDAQFNGHKKDVGYKVTISETCSPDSETPNPKIITDVRMDQANVSDHDILEPSIDDREDRGLKPETELTDNGFESDANHQSLKEKGVDLVAPPTGKPPEGFGIIDFDLGEDGRSLKACPAGQSCTENRVNENAQKTISYFDPEKCRACPHSEDCPIKITKLKARVEWNWSKPRLEARRLAFQEDQETINLFKQRAGGEASFSQLKVNLGLDRLRCRGASKSKFKITMAATALNIIRVFNWLASQGSSASKIRKKAAKRGKRRYLLPLYRHFRHFFQKIARIFQMNTKFVLIFSVK